MDTRWYKAMRSYLGLGDSPSSSAVTNGDSSSSDVDETLNPGPVDNSPLFKDGEEAAAEGEIREHLIDDIDYKLVPEETWQAIVAFFGQAQGQKAVHRKVFVASFQDYLCFNSCYFFKVVEQGMFVKHCRVEVYFIELQLACHPHTKTNVKKSKFSKNDLLGTECQVC